MSRPSKSLAKLKGLAALSSRYTRLKRLRLHTTTIVIACIVGFVGLISLQLSQAVGFSLFSEAESGTISGNASKTANPTAAGSQAVTFGNLAEVAAPYKAQAITGGDSLAIVWTASHGTIKQYEVYRNDTKHATVTPNNTTGVIAADILGRTYIDRSVARGTSYSYKVRAISNDGRASAFTSAGNVTHPQITNTTPIPTVTFDTSQGGSDLTSYLENQIRPHLQTWYPKMADALAYPDYTVSPTIRVSMSLTSGIANASWSQGLINVNPTWLRTNLADGGGMFLHEAAHLVQAYEKGDPSGWATEGIADWIRDWFTMERYHIPRPNAVLSQHYSESGHMLAWAQATYSPGLVRKVNVAIHKGTYTNSFFTNLTGGRTGEQLYAEAKQQYYGSIGPVTGINGKCADVFNGDPASGTKIQLFDCNTSNAQKWSAMYRDAGLHGTTKKRFGLINSAIAPDGRCLDVQSSGTANGTLVQLWACNNSKAQEWTKGSNDSLVNPNSGKCLATTAGGSDNGNQLIINDCDGSAGQRWSAPQ